MACAGTHDYLWEVVRKLRRLRVKCNAGHNRLYG